MINTDYVEDKSRTRNHYKARLRYHVIFSTKYRKKILNNIKDTVFDAFNYSVKDTNIKILDMNIDKDHIHFLLDLTPETAISDVIKRMKQLSTYHIYKYQGDYMKKYYWKHKHIWTHGYFVATVGLVSEQVVSNYIKNQGKDYYIN